MQFIPWSTTKDGVVGLLVDLRQPANFLALMGFLSGETFDGFFASLREN